MTKRHAEWNINILLHVFHFGLVNILLGKFDSSKKEMKMIKTQFLWQKKCQESVCKCEIAFFTVNSPYWPVM